MTSCALCPRGCARAASFCGETDTEYAHVAKAMPHHWEEPRVRGTHGSGAVFFSGCNLRCAFCQNHTISQARPLPGERVDAAGLARVFWDLAGLGVENINLVTPSHVLPVAREAMRLARRQGFALPFVWNSNGYENAQALQSLEGLVDLYLPDLKYHDDALALAYSAAPGYFACACAALREMHRQGELLVRHLVLPGARKDSMRLLDWVAAQLPGARISLLAQYTPMHRASGLPPLHRRLTGFEYQSVVDHALSLGLKGYMQRREAATQAYTPEF